MRIMVHLTLNGEKETILEGDTDVFDRLGSYEGTHKRLAAIGFWLRHWNYQGCGGPKHQSRVFVPWSSALYIQELK